MASITNRRLEKLKKVVGNRQSNFIVVLEDIYDPHNAAAVLRSCDTFGIQNVYFIFDKQTPYNPKKVGKSSSSTANKWLDYKIYSDSKSCLKELKSNGYKIYGTILSKNATDIKQTNFNNKKIAIVFGNEHSGLSKVAQGLCDKLVYIPQLGIVQSLNVSVSAGIFLYEASKQRDQKYLLSKANRNKLLKDFINR